MLWRIDVSFFVICLCFVLSCFVLGHGPLYGEEIKPADSAQPAAAEAPPQLEEAEAADEAAMQSLVVRIDSPSSEPEKRKYGPGR